MFELWFDGLCRRPIAARKAGLMRFVKKGNFPISTERILLLHNKARHMAQFLSVV